jgi:hypothetical protein
MQYYLSYIVVVGFIGGGNQSTPEKTTDLPQVTDKHYHIMLFQVNIAWVGFELTTLVMIGTDCLGNYKFSLNIVESHVKHHKPTKPSSFSQKLLNRIEHNLTKIIRKVVNRFKQYTNGLFVILVQQIFSVSYLEYSRKTHKTEERKMLLLMKLQHYT